MTAERAKRVAREALKAGGDPKLVQKILLSTLTGVKGGSVLEKRLTALLNTVPHDKDRVRLAKIAWGHGRWGPRVKRIACAPPWGALYSTLEVEDGRT